MALLTFEGKKFYADGRIEEGEFKDGELKQGQKRDIIYGLLFGLTFLLSNDIIYFEGKRFYADGTRCEGEF